MTAPRLPLQISEKDFLVRIIDYAHVRGWLAAHFLPSTTSYGTATWMRGDIGYPDLSLARRGRLIVAELKRHNGRATPGQRRWLEHLGEHGRLWTPSDWPDIMEELK